MKDMKQPNEDSKMFSDNFKIWSINTLCLTITALPYTLVPDMLFILWSLHLCMSAFMMVGGFDLEDEY